ncbi:MAG: carboxypeptidase regulatory-like domain-containing protein [Acidobacteria bacterium]|nr:carboxypeptidase regulatory-like domain-containing protein [Acidobacteriota bacterium]
MRRLQLVAAVATVTMGLAAQAAAQTGRVQGIVRDLNGEPIRGAIVRATHPEAMPNELTAATDERGRFAIIGLRTATSWHFVAEAPGYFPAEGDATVRSAIGAPLTFTLRRDPGPIPGALVGNIQQQITAARELKEAGRLDEAIAAYQTIQSRNARLTTINLVLADLYREKAQKEPDGAARQSLLEKALAAYDAVLQEDATHGRAKVEREEVAADLQALTRQ